jgi:hypothetical protein
MLLMLRQFSHVGGVACRPRVLPKSERYHQQFISPPGVLCHRNFRLLNDAEWASHIPYTGSPRFGVLYGDWENQKIRRSRDLG